MTVAILISGAWSGPAGIAAEPSAATAASNGTWQIVGKVVGIDAGNRTVSIVPARADKGAAAVVLAVTDETAITQGGDKKALTDLELGYEVRVTAVQGVATAIVRPTQYEWTRMTLPDFSEGLAGLVGPFFWGRATDIGADARICDEYGRADSRGEFLWLYQLKRGPRKNPQVTQLHERNNLVSRDPRIAYEFQPWRVTINSPKPGPAHEAVQVMKLMVGYVAKDHKFVHGDNTDMIHLAATPRVAAFVPIRRARQTLPPGEQADYSIDTSHVQAPLGVFELAANETMASGPGYTEIARQRVLLDLRDRFKAEKAVCPGTEKPMFRFTIEGGGQWTLKIELDGRDGLAGGSDEKGWDMVFTQNSPGAKPYTVDLTPDNSAWALSVFNPGGAPESSDILVHLTPFDRATGQAVPWPDRMRRIATCPVEKLAQIGATGDPK
jgi:hypothetical protein